MRDADVIYLDDPYGTGPIELRWSDADGCRRGSARVLYCEP